MKVETTWELIVRGPGAYDIVGDVHGCWETLTRLCAALGYDQTLRRPDRRLVFVGDLINRGPDSVSVLRAVMDLVAIGSAFAVLGNHDAALLRFLHGHECEIKSDLACTLAAIDGQADHETFLQRTRIFLDRLPLILQLDEGRLTVAHAGLACSQEQSDTNRQILLNGRVIGKSAYGKTLRQDWARDYHGDAFVAYGHTPVARPQFRHNTIDIDTGALRGGLLTALRWPERYTVSVPSGLSQRP